MQHAVKENHRFVYLMTNTESPKHIAIIIIFIDNGIRDLKMQIKWY